MQRVECSRHANPLGAEAHSAQVRVAMHRLVMPSRFDCLERRSLWKARVVGMVLMQMVSFDAVLHVYSENGRNSLYIR